MINSDRKRFAELMTGLSDYYGKPISDIALLVYWSGLQKFDIEAIEKAAAIHLEMPDEAGRWFPFIADFKRIIEGRPIDQGALAWSKVDRAVRVVGTHADVVFDDPVIHRIVMDMGGWIKMGEYNEKDFVFAGKEFVTRYQGYKMRGEKPDYPAVLIGISNANNGKEGYRGQPPVLIGDAMAAQFVLDNGTDGPVLKLQRVEMKQIGNSI